MKANATIEAHDFGRLPDGRPVKRFTLTNRHGLCVKVITYGGIVAELHVPDRNGRFANIVHGFDNLDTYVERNPFFGAITGRVANRIGKARFTLDGRVYSLAANNGQNHLHGGLRGFDKMLWEGKAQAVNGGDVAVELTYLSRDGEEGYPGNLQVKVVYTLTGGNELRIDTWAATDKSTPVNITNHDYYNLAGAGDILGHEIMIAADHFTPVDKELIPTGEIAPVKGTPLDFTGPMLIGARIEQLKPHPGGYDHNFVLNNGGKSLSLAARVREPNSGRALEVHTTEPGLQFYTGNFLRGQVNGLNGKPSVIHSGFCLETQHFPDSVNHPNFPSIILRPGETYRTVTVLKFLVM